MIDLANNLFVMISALLVFTMTISVGLLEVGELGEGYTVSLLKTMLITGSSLFFMAFVGFNTAFAPAVGGIIGNPLYNGLFLGGFSPDVPGLLSDVWWSTAPAYFATNLSLGTYFLFETAFASVTLALVGVVTLRKMKLEVFCLYSIPYFVIIWNLPAAWIWNPTGWLYIMGMRDFAGGLIVHAAAGAAGLGILLQVWLEERKKGLKESPKVTLNLSPGWLTLSILLLWVGWFGFNPGSVLAFNSSATVVILTTFLAAASSFLSMMFFQYLRTKQNPGLLYAVNGILTGLVIITPVAGFVSPGSAVVLGLIGGPLFLAGEKWFAKAKWFSDPVGPTSRSSARRAVRRADDRFLHATFFCRSLGDPSLPDGLLFGGGYPAAQQLAIEAFGTATVLGTVFVLSFLSARLNGAALHGITTDYAKEKLVS